MTLAIAGHDPNRGLPKDEHMKHTKLMAIGTLLLLGVSGAAAQSLADYAREARKKKAEPSAASRHYDNDNLPGAGDLSVVGPPASDDKAVQATKPAISAAAANAEHQQAADEFQKKIDQQKEKIDSLSHELDLEQREYRLRAAAFYGDAGDRLRNAGQWDKDDAQYKSDIDSKEKAIDAARQELGDLQEQARKAGVQEKDRDNTDSKDNIIKTNDKDTSKDNDKDKDK